MLKKLTIRSSLIGIVVALAAAVIAAIGLSMLGRAP